MKKEAKFNLKTLIPIIILMFVLVYVAFAAINATITRTDMVGNLTVAIGGNTIYQSTVVNITISLTGTAGGDNVSNVTIMIDASFLNFTNASNISTFNPGAHFLWSQSDWTSTNLTLTWNITQPELFTAGNTSAFAFNVTPISNVEIRDTYIWVRVYNISGDLLLDDRTSITIDVDNKNPVVSLETVNHTNSSTNVSVLLNFTVSDLNIDTCFLWSSNSWGQKQNGSGRTLNNTGFYFNFSGGDGSYVWNVRCNDTIGQWGYNATNYTITIDTIPPVYDYFNITNGTNIIGTPNITNGYSHYNFSVNNESGDGTVSQGATIAAFFNFSDATTGIKSTVLQVWNVTRWMNVTAVNYGQNTDGVMYNLTYTFCNTPDCYQSGNDVWLRVFAADHVNNANYTRNLTVHVNDTVAPRIDTISISGGGNGTNITTTTISLNWTISERNNLVWLSWVMDSKSTTLGWYGNYTVSAGSVFTQTISQPLMDSMKLGSKVKGGYDPGVIPSFDTLTNGTHSIALYVMDNWGNMRFNNYSFTVDTSSPNKITAYVFETIGSPVLSSPANISLYGYMNITVNFTGASALRTLQFNTSCNSTWITITNATAFQPFNGSESGCSNQDALYDVMVKATSFTNSEGTATFSVGLDNVAPAITLDLIDSIATASIEGYEFSRLNITINYTTPNEYTSLSSVGYYLDGNPYVILRDGNVDQSLSYWNVINVTYGGKHTLILQANDSVGNAANTTYTFYTIGLVDIDGMRGILEGYLTNTSASNVNITFANGTVVSGYETINSANSWRLAIHLELNSSQPMALNVTIDGIDASKVVWNHINFSAVNYDAATITNINSNFTATVVRMVRFNRTDATGLSTIADFISDADAYYGRVVVPYNFTKLTTFVAMWFKTNDYSDRTLIGACGAVAAGGNAPYTATTPGACYNLTADGKTTIFVPYFSTVAVVNDTNASTITITEPNVGGEWGQNTSTFYINLTVAGDVSSCAFRVNASGYSNGVAKDFSSWTAVAMDRTGTSPQVCLSQYPISLANGSGAADTLYNLTLNVTDAVGNQNITYLIFNVTDILIPTWTNVTNSSIGTTSAVIGIESNEYVNASVSYGSIPTVRVQLASTAFTTKKPTITLSDLSGEISYNYSVKVCDYAGNCITSDIFNFTTDKATTTTTTTTAATTSAGGGGATVAAPTNIAAKQSQLWNKIGAGESVTMTISNDNIAITQVVVNVENAVTSVSIETSSLKDQPSDTTIASSKVYQYLQIKPGNIGDADISSVTINFEVTTAWLTTNNVANDDVVLLRYKDGAWNELPTKIVGTTPYNVKYESTTPGFSYFAIASKSGIAEVAEGATPEEAVTPPSEAVTPPSEAVTPPAGANYIWIIVLIAVVIIVLIYLKTKKKNE